MLLTIEFLEDEFINQDYTFIETVLLTLLIKTFRLPL